ncbi:MAG: hypothetical protein JWQ35_2688 [Bacteriovoracaceae bacterium]|nr:hypothetical protein [Bacteriovoracaceae bacterium]
MNRLLVIFLKASIAYKTSLESNILRVSAQYIILFQSRRADLHRSFRQEEEQRVTGFNLQLGKIDWSSTW